MAYGIFRIYIYLRNVPKIHVSTLRSLHIGRTHILRTKQTFVLWLCFSFVLVLPSWWTNSDPGIERLVSQVTVTKVGDRRLLWTFFRQVVKQEKSYFNFSTYFGLRDRTSSGFNGPLGRYLVCSGDRRLPYICILGVLDESVLYTVYINDADIYRSVHSYHIVRSIFRKYTRRYQVTK